MTVVTTKELRELLQISRTHLRRLIDDGMPVMRIGTGTQRLRLRYCLEHVIPWLENRDPMRRRRRRSHLGRAL